MAAGNPPPLAWNCHVHCFNSDKHQFKPTRAYTPQQAPLGALCENALTDRIMLVQATIEDGPDGLLECLNESREKHCDKLFRGTIFADPAPERALEKLEPLDFDRFHEAGVRSVRIHGSYGGFGDNLDWVRDQFLRAARLYPVKRYGWSISAQLSLSMWSAMADTLLHDKELAGVPILADHNGCASPKDVGGPELVAFLGLLSAGKIHVKVGALHRRAPDDIQRMRPVVELFVEKGPRAVLWGSDWPHVDGSRKGVVPSPPLQGVAASEELRALRSWLSEPQWNDMLVSNPARLFGS